MIIMFLAAMSEQNQEMNELAKKNSLIGNGIIYDEVPLLNDDDIDFETLEKKVDEHNNFARRVPILEEQIEVANHRIDDLEHKF